MNKFYPVDSLVHSRVVDYLNEDKWSSTIQFTFALYLRHLGSFMLRKLGGMYLSAIGVCLFVLGIGMGQVFAVDFKPIAETSGLSTGFAGGTGTEADPFKIGTWVHLDQVRLNMTAHFLMINDLDSSTEGYDDFASFGANTGEGWLPIGSVGNEFKGKFDGAGHVIKDLVIYRDLTTGTGLFGAILGGVIRNLGVVDGYVESHGAVGLVAGIATNTNFEGVFSSGNVISLDGQVRAGGLIGNLGLGSVLRFSFSTAAVTGESESGSVMVGGLVGSSAGAISDCYSLGSVYGSSNANTVNVFVGGLVGRGIGIGNSIVRSFSAGLVDGFTPQSSKLFRGGLVASIDSGFSVLQSFWNTETSTVLTSAGGAGAVGKLTGELKFEVTFAGWDFSTAGVWSILKSTEGGMISYPYLKWVQYDDSDDLVAVNPLPGAEIFYFEGGFGTISNPYQIANWNQLHAIREKLAGNFVLINDLDQATVGYADHASLTANNGQGWEPIGLDGNMFSGSLDGAGFVIKGLTQNRISPADYAGGLFGIVEKGFFKNVGIVDAKIISRGSAGILAAEVGTGFFDSEVKIDHVYTTGTVKSINGTSRAGGILGLMGSNTTLEKSYSTAEVSGSTIDPRNVRSGGLVGESSGSVINCFSTGDVSSQGFNSAFGITAGGLVGSAYGSILKSYSTGKVSGSSELGEPFLGGLVGFSVSTTIGDTFWDQESSLQTTSLGGMGKTTAEMKSQASFTNWDFTPNTGIWKIQKAEDGFISYPYLSGLPIDVPLASPTYLPIPGLEIIVRPQVISFDEISIKTYGDAPFELGNQFTDRGLAVKYTAEDSTLVSITGNKATILKAGSTKIIATQSGSIQYFAADTVKRLLTINKAPLVIIAEDKTIGYGENDPGFSVAYQGFVLGESQVNLTGVLAYEREPGKNVGVYSILPKGLSSTNYEITFKAGKLEIAKANLTITALDSERMYGDQNPDFKFEYKGLVNGDLKAKIEPTISTTAVQNTGVGTYPIQLAGAEDPNYIIKLVDGVLTIKPASLKIQANPQSKISGTEDPELTFVSTGWKGTDSENILTGKLVREAGEAIGRYPILLGNLKANNNYEVNFISDKLEILPAEIASLKNPEQIKTPWSVKPIFPSKVLVKASNGKELELAVTWDETKLNLFKRGTYLILGTLVLPSDLINPKGLTATIEIVVLEKEAPKDVELSQNVFDPDPDDFYQEIGFFTVVDPLDQTHLIILISGALDNQYFEVKDGKLFWSSPEEFVGKKEFQIKIRVEDRDGNVLEKTFQITRNRKRLNRGILIAPEIYTAFTPDGDGVNDTWGVPDLEYFPSIRVEVFDRNGKMVFFTEDGEKRWDATVDGKRVPAGTYYWIQKDSDTGEIKRGYLTIVKN